MTPVPGSITWSSRGHSIVTFAFGPAPRPWSSLIFAASSHGTSTVPPFAWARGQSPSALSAALGGGGGGGGGGGRGGRRGGARREEEEESEVFLHAGDPLITAPAPPRGAPAQSVRDDRASLLLVDLRRLDGHGHVVVLHEHLDHEVPVIHPGV